MKKKVYIALGAVVCLVFAIVVLFGMRRPNNEAVILKEEELEKEKLVVAFPGIYESTSDMAEVAVEINKIVGEKLGFEVEFQIGFQQYGNKIDKMLAGREQLDIVCMSSQISYLETYINGYLYEIEEVLERYGQGIIAAVGRDNIDACRINGTLYGLPNNRDYATGWDAYLLNKEILDKYEIRVEDLKSIEDLEKVYDILLKEEPDMIPVSPGGRKSMFSNFPLADEINGFPMGGHLNYGQDEEIVNVLASDEYMERLKRVREWYLKGYMGDYSLLELYDTRAGFQKGELFSTPAKGKPGVVQQESVACGKELAIVQFGENAITYNSISAVPWVITQNTISPEKSMQLLNLMYTDADIMNLLSYGIEGKHYVKMADGHITFPAGKNDNAFVGMASQMPNQFITYVWEGNPLNLWENMQEYNESALQSCEIGFNFDISQVKSEFIAVNNVYFKYKRIVENGLVDPKEGVRAMLKELDENGLENVIREKRKQFLKWKRE